VETGPIPPTIHRPRFCFPANIHHLESKIKSKKCKMKSDFGHFSVAGSEGPKKTKKE
jgi:hypothetical protein